MSNESFGGVRPLLGGPPAPADGVTRGGLRKGGCMIDVDIRPGRLYDMDIY